MNPGKERSNLAVVYVNFFICAAPDILLFFSHSGSKYMKNDQHDSGIEISEHHDSAVSSTRSSPSTEQKLKVDSLSSKLENTSIQQSGEAAPKPQRQAKVRAEKAYGVPKQSEDTIAQKPDVNNKEMKSVEDTLNSKLPYSFNDAFKYSKVLP